MRPPVHHRFRTEAEYFYELDRELINNLRRRAARQEERVCLAEASHVFDPAVLDGLERLGFDHNTVALLFIVPLIQVAWGDGSMSQIERDHILAIATLRGVKPNSPASEQLVAWLERPPSVEFFDGTLKVINSVLRTLPTEEHDACRQALVLSCRDAAAAPCHVFGWVSRICHAKQKVIDEISKQLQTLQATAA